MTRKQKTAITSSMMAGVASAIVAMIVKRLKQRRSLQHSAAVSGS